MEGLSPLARGNLVIDPKKDGDWGPIPARAGEPAPSKLNASPTRAYPRSRGGTWCTPNSRRGGGGLSPLARGNPIYIRQPALKIWPIPARAGEPKTPSPTPSPTRAYPRSRGGTDLINAGAPAGGGPIPARAGEPHRDHIVPISQGAYPRSRGGTRSAKMRCSMPKGLSPLARGNQLAAFVAGFQSGPIPARAGEPCSSACRWTRPRAYPRSRGGTGITQASSNAAMGLSPLARGNLSHLSH